MMQAPFHRKTARAVFIVALLAVLAGVAISCSKQPVRALAEGAEAAGSARSVAPASGLLLAPPFTPQGGHAFHARFSSDWPADTAHERASRLALFEDGLALGPAHALHETIRVQGAGAFSHWSDGLWFSTSDGSDPNLNGRSYTVAWTGGDGLGQARWRPYPRDPPFVNFPGGQPPDPADRDADRIEAPGAPRTIWIHVIDALRADTLDAVVSGTPVMPALAAFAASETVRFTQTYANSGLTKTSTASLFTGLWPQRHGVLHGLLPTAPDGMIAVLGLDPRFTTLAESLARLGWDTRSHPFSVHARAGDGLLKGFHSLDLAVRSDNPFGARPPAPEARLFAYEHLLGVHAPYRPSADARAALGTPPPRRLDPGSTEWFHRDLDSEEVAELRAAYLALARDADAAFARRLDWLRASDRWRDTLLVVTADHGEAFGEHGSLQHASALFEENVRVPLLLRFPESSPFAALHGRSFDQRVSLADLLPTLLELVGAPAPGYALDGRSLTPILRGEEPDPLAREVALRGSFPDTAADGSLRLFVQDAVLSGRHKALFGLRLQSSQTGAETFTRGDWLARLHDLQADPAEARDLSAEQPQRFLQMLARHAEYSAPLRAAGHPSARHDLHESEGPVGLEPSLEQALRALGYVR